MGSGIFWAILAEVLIGASLVVDKILLEDKPGRMLPYVFWIGVLNIFGLLLIPFGFDFPNSQAIFLSFATGAAFLATLACLYGALTRGGATNTLPIIGGFSPAATYVFGSFIFLTPLNVAAKIAFVLLVIGGFILFFSERFNLKKILPWVLGAAVSIALTNVFQKLAFNEGGFVSIFVTIKAATFLLAPAMLLLPSLRKRIFETSISAPKKNRIIYLLNRLASGVGSFLIFYAISLNSHPALIESLSGLRYVVIFIGVFILSKLYPALVKEKMRGWPLFTKLAATLIIFIALIGLSAQAYYEKKSVPQSKDITWGVTFSELMSKKFRLNWQENFRAILNDLRPKGIRLVAYWDMIEPKRGQLDFTDLDWQMKEAAKARVPVVLVVGQRVPRWPECHFPSWVDVNIDPDFAHNALINYIGKVVEHYKGQPNLLYWEVENEPFLMFGECPKNDSSLLDREMAEVRKTDPSRKILLTDGGEFGDWYKAAKRADIFGTTLYRKVHNSIFGYITYPLTPEFYPLRRDMTRFLTGKPDQEFIIIELGLEPWMMKQIYEVPTSTQFGFFNENDFKNIISYARQTGYTTFYAWGAEWWYWLKTTGDTRFWDMAKDVFAGKTI